MIPTLYGIPNCDTMKKARVWLDQHGVAYRFHDYKKSGIDRASLALWVGEHGWQTVLNRAGTTFRKLAEADQVVVGIGFRIGSAQLVGPAAVMLDDAIGDVAHGTLRV